MFKKFAVALGLFVGAVGIAYAANETITTFFATSNPNPVLVQGSDGTNARPVAVSATGTVATGGNVASGATDSGNPVKVGGVYNSTKPTLTNGQRGDAQLDLRGSIGVAIFGGGTADIATVGTPSLDGTNFSTVQILRTIGVPYGSNAAGNAWDRWRNNNDITVLASAARTTTTASSDLTNYNGRGLHLVIEVTAASATPSVVCTIQGKDAQGSAYYTILASAAITGISSNVYRVFPGATAAANAAANDIIPRTWRVNCVHADGDSITYSIGASVIL